MAMRAPSPPEEPPAVREVLYGLTVTPQKDSVSRLWEQKTISEEAKASMTATNCMMD